MTNYIGPIDITIPHIRDEDNVKRDGTEQINIICSPEQAKQIIGLCEDSVKNVYGNRRILTSKQSRWGILPINTSENLKVNEAMTHKGFYQLMGEPEEIVLNPKVSRLNLPAEMISKNHNEILSILYSKGGEDGSDIEHKYEDNETQILLNDTFDGAYTDYWGGYDAYNMTSHSASTSGGKLVFTGTNGSSGVTAPWGGINIESKSRYAPPWEIEFDLEYVTGTDHNMSVYIVEALPHVWTDVTIHSSDTNYIRIYLYAHGGGLYYAVLKCVRGVISYLKPETALNISTEKNPSFKVGYYPGGGLEVYIDKAGGTNYTKIWGRANTGLNWSNPGLMYHFDNMSGASRSMKSSGFKLSVPTPALYPYIVVAPPGAVCNETPTFTRPSEDGNIQCFKNLTVPLNYQISPTDFYKGMVKGMNGNYTDNTYRLITSNEVELDPVKFYMSNGLIKLETISNGVKYYYWDGSSYVLIDTFTLPSNIKLIRPFYVSKDVFTLQLDRTLWTLRAGKPFVYVKHPYDDLGYTLKPSHYHDGILNNFVSSGDVSMLTQFYDLCFTTYNMLTTNQYSAETDLIGFVAQGSTITRIADGYDGAYCINIVTNNAVSGEGVQLYPHSALPITPAVGLPVYAYAWVKGSGSVVIQLIERDSEGAVVATRSSSVHTLTGSYVKLSVLSLISSTATAYISMKILTPTRQLATINSDAHGLGPTMDSSISGSTNPPISSARYGMIITQKNPTTIKSDSIPASALTGIGVYDQMQPPISNDHYLQLAREWYKPTVQRLALQGVV